MLWLPRFIWSKSSVPCLVLSTMFAFFYVHAGRGANTDATYTLLILLTAVTLREAREARWRIDGWAFIGRLFWYDFIERSVSTIEDHPGSLFYYVNVLQTHHDDWLMAAGPAWTIGGIRGHVSWYVP